MCETNSFLEENHTLSHKRWFFCHIITEFMQDFEVGKKHWCTHDFQEHLLSPRKDVTNFSVYLAAGFLVNSNYSIVENEGRRKTDLLEVRYDELGDE